MTTSVDITGLRKAVTKQLDLRLDQYEGIAKEGDLIIDCNPGPTLNQLFVGTANGSLEPVVSGGGGNTANSNYANFAGQVVDSTQSNITTLGTLTSLELAGDITLAGDGTIANPANSSLDPINPNVSTLVFTPDNLYSSQSLVLDPTAPGHIHLRSPTFGSNIDEPVANVFLGGEATAFEISSGFTPEAVVHSNNNTWIFQNTGGILFPDGTTQTTAYMTIQPPYRGFYAGLNRFYGTDPSVNQIIISNATDIPTYENTSSDTNDDSFTASNLGTATIVVMLNLYGNSTVLGISPDTLKAVTELFIDNVLYDGATPITDAATAQSRFYANWSTIFSPASGDLYQDFIFYTPDTFQGVIPTGGTGTGFEPILRNATTTYIVNGFNNTGSGYTVGDILTVTGDLYSGTTPTNDATFTVTAVDGSGGVTEYTVSGTPVNIWPTDSIQDGGDDQYDTGNFINTDASGGPIPYADGLVNTGPQWGAGSEYVTVYETSTWAMMAFNTSVTTCYYSGDMGADSSGSKSVQNLIGGTISPFNLGDFIFDGSVMTATGSDINIIANDDLYLDALGDDIHIRAEDDARIYVGYNFSNNNSSGQWIYRTGTPPYVEWPDGTQQYTAWTANQSQTQELLGGLGNPVGYVPSSDGSGNFVWLAMASGGGQAIQYDNGGYPVGTPNAAIYGTGAIHVNSVSTLANTNVTAGLLSLMDSDLFAMTITSPITLQPVDVPAAGRTGSFVLQITNGGSSVTWWSGIKWNNGTPPTLTASGTDVLGFYTFDGGTSWVGLVLAQNIS